MNENDKEYIWCNELSMQFLQRGYLLPGQTVDQRVTQICEYAENVLNKSLNKKWYEYIGIENPKRTKIKGFAKKLKSYFKKGWFSFSTPVWTNFGVDRGSPISCVTGETWINTYENGGKQAQDICIGDLVLTHKGRYKPVSNIIKTEERQNIFKLKTSNRMTNLFLTGDHLVLTNIGWVRTDELDPDKHLIAINRQIDITQKNYKIDMRKFVPYEFKEENSRILKTGKNVDVVSYFAQPYSEIEVDKDLAWALGLWFAEGSLTRNKEKKPNGCRITVNDKDELPLAHKWLDIITSKFGINGNGYHSIVERDNRCNSWFTVNVNSLVIGNFFDSFRKNCKTKTIPQWIIELPDSILSQFLEGLLAGDGSIRSNGTVKLTLANPQMLLQVYQIALKLGKSVSLQMQDKPGKLSTTVHVYTINFHSDTLSTSRVSGNSAIAFSDGLSYARIRFVEKTEKVETVYDFTVEDDHSFSAAGVILHNCFGSTIDDSMQSILNTHAEVGMMSKIGGGTSAFFGHLRERGSPITNNGESFGSVHFMKLFDNLINIVSQGSCYIEGTEVLTNNGFKDFRDVLSTDKIAQLDEFNNISFTKDYELVNQDFDGKLVCINGKKRTDSVSIAVTPNHRMVVSKRKMNNRKRYWSEETEIVIAEELKLHRDNRLILAGWAGDGAGLTDEDRLRIAYQADGIKDGENRKIRFHFSKTRKIDRLTSILKRLNIDYVVSPQSDDTTMISFEYDENIKKCTFAEWVQLDSISGIWAQEFIDELSYWDGGVSHGGAIIYCSIIESNIHLVQAIATLADKKTRLSVREKYENRKKLFKIIISEISYRGGETCVISNESYKGKVHCAIVPQGKILVRYKNRVMVCGNTRRGNFAAYLPIEHKDINEFLTIRREGSPLQDIFFGVTITDEWMQSMIDGDHSKRSVWAKVLESRANTGLPYVVWIDNVNNNTADVYKDKGMKITHSNLCVTGDQLVVTSEGLKTAFDLANTEKSLTLFDGEKSVKSSPMKLIEKNAAVFEVITEAGRSHKITDYHKLKTEFGMIPLKELKEGDRIFVQRNKGLFGKTHEPEMAFLLGLYQTDGTQTEKTVFIDLWENDFDLIEQVENYVKHVYEKNNWLDVPTFFDQQTGFSDVKKKRLGSAKLKQFGFHKGYVPNWIFEADEETQWSYIKGLYVGDGTVGLGQSNGNPIQLSLANIDKDFLQKIQIILSNLGISTSIHVLHEEGSRLLPDGKGGEKHYQCQKRWRLICGNKPDSLAFNENTGFLDRKGVKLEDRIYRDNSKKFDVIKEIKFVGWEDVYCLTVDSDEHVWTCNGFITSNCTEIFLPDTIDESFVCDLSSMNILHYDEWKDTDAIEVLIFFLDAIMTDFIDKASEIPFMERAVRFAERHRALGLGWVGWHSYLMSKMIPYESMQAKFLNVKVAQTIQSGALKASELLAEMYGEPEVLKGYGRRNTTTCAIAPTKSSAFILGQLTESTEPMRANIVVKDLQKGKFTIKNIYLEKTLDSYDKNTPETWRSILEQAGSVQHLGFLTDNEKDVFKTFSEIIPKEVIIQAAQRQKYIDQGQSLNLLIDPSVPIKEINALYIEAWNLGIKSVYYQIGVNAAQQLSRSISTCRACES